VDADYGSSHAFCAALERVGLRYGVAIRDELAMSTAEAPRNYPAPVLAEAIPAAYFGCARSWACFTSSIAVGC
jgi:hypothetical protein